MSDTLLLIFILLIAGAGTALAVVSLYNIHAEAPVDDREYRDPLPPLLRLVWPTVRVFAHYMSAWMSPQQREKIQHRLQATGVDYLLTPEQYLGLRAVSALGWALLLGMVLHAVNRGSLILPLLAGAGGYFYPALWLRDMRLRRRRAMLKTLPVFLDFITLAVEAGLNLSGAIGQAVAKGPVGPLRQEFERMLRDLRAGVPRADALHRMAERVDMTEMSSLVSALVQAERVGASLGPTLRAQAEQRRAERFQRAEKLALEAPVKLIGPLVAFIFPVTFIILAFPVVVQLMQLGVL